MHKPSSRFALNPVKQVPRFISVWDEIAKKSGLAVETGLNPDGILLSQWSGTQQQMLSTCLFTDCYTFPRPGRSVGFKNAQIGGYMNTLEGGSVIAHIRYCETPLSIELKDGVEIVKFKEEIYYHGERSALVLIKVCHESYFPDGKRNKRNIGGGWTEKRQSITRLPDGTYLFKSDTEEAFEAQKREYEEWERGQLQGRKPAEPLTAQDFKESRMEEIKKALFMSVITAGYKEASEDCPFYFSEDIHLAAIAKVREIIGLYENSAVVKRRDPVNHERLKSVAAAQTDAGFQRFMANLQASSHGH